MNEYTVPAAALEWVVGSYTGQSSQAIFRKMLGIPVEYPDGDKWDNYRSVASPRDGADIGRCLQLLEKMPEWRTRIGEMAEVSTMWALLVGKWEEIERLHALQDGHALYALIRAAEMEEMRAK